MTATRIPWTADENLVIASVHAGTLTMNDMFEMLSSRPLAAMRRKYVQHGKADYEERHKRAMKFGSAALLREMIREKLHSKGRTVVLAP